MIVYEPFSPLAAPPPPVARQPRARRHRWPDRHRRLALTPGAPRRGRPKPHHFDLTVAADRHADHDYLGPAVLDLPGAEYRVLATLAGHTDPIDGRYHWYGRLDPAEAVALPEPARASAFLVLPGRAPAAASLTERDPWGNLRVTGIGAPPFALAT
ncbi:DUF4873 domain-containing protein [Nocardia fluminea]|uniref:DUF4873 domain-containing protein n=1 Tax=Nocardia fluminea TaxID=134984 RepID=UPI0033ED24B6